MIVCLYALESSTLELTAYDRVSKHIYTSQLLEMLLEHQLKSDSRYRRWQSRDEMERAVNLLLKSDDIRITCQAYYSRHEYSIYILSILIDTGRESTYHVSCQGLRDICRTHFSRILAQSLQFRHRDGMYRTFHSIFFHSCRDETCMEIKETVHIQNCDFLPRHDSVRRNCRILIHGKPCPFEHAQRGYPPMIRILYTLESNSYLLEQRLHHS